MARIEVFKTYKLFIGGQFPRSESGRYYTVKNAKGQALANISLSSRKDFRNAVSAARSAQPSWAGRAAFNRGQILYRIAEMMEGRADQFVHELEEMGLSTKAAHAETSMAIDRIVYYAGWCDKYQPIFSSVNPVASSHFNFSVPEPMGVVALIADEESPLLGLVSVVLPAIAGGNACIVLASESKPLSAVTFGEVLATSDLPAGVVNILTGNTRELAGQFSSHMDVNAVVYARNNPEEKKMIQENGTLNIKRSFFYNKTWTREEGEGPFYIMDLQEIKTTWHPIENIGAGGGKY
jgi:acyl-CoA reductase-like NAD-dependent aldehyde dehydrogenase